MTMNKKILILGDTHAIPFKYAMESILFQGWQHAMCSVRGAAIDGLRNPNGPVNALDIFKTFLADKDRNSTVVIQLGEVDCGFLFWYRAQHFDEPVPDQLRASILGYVNFVGQLKHAGFSDIVVTGAVLPAIQDGVNWGASTNKRRDVAAPLAERTALTLTYNSMLKSLAESSGVRYLDITDDLLDPLTKTVRKTYLGPDPHAAHLQHQPVSALWAKKLYMLLAIDNTVTDAATAIYGR